MKKEIKSYHIRILTLGNSTVGKTSIITRFVENKFFDMHIGTIGVDLLKKEIMINNTPLTVQILDSAGQEKYRSVSKQYFKKAQGIFLVFDLTSRNSFESITSWVNLINKESVGGIPVVLVGNKSDLPDRSITNEEAIKFADKQNFKYFETSALNGNNINESFYALSELALQKEKKRTFEGGVKLEKIPLKKKTFC